MSDLNLYTRDYVTSQLPEIFELARQSGTVDDFRSRLSYFSFEREYFTFDRYEGLSEGSIIRVRDCARAINRILTRRSEKKAGFSFAKAIFDIGRGEPRDDLTAAFYADVLHVFSAIQARGPGRAPVDLHLFPTARKGRNAAIARSNQLDMLSMEVSARLKRIPDGLDEEAVDRRNKRALRILKKLKARPADWYNWQWQIDNIVKDPDIISELAGLTDDQKQAVRQAGKRRLPFGITPYYLSLMDNSPGAGRDMAIRAQVIPGLDYIDKLEELGRDNSCLDFMREADTSPINLITRRYPAICIFKPFNSCPQICVYCQRNWEIDDVMAPAALAEEKDIKAALSWIREHPEIHEVLMTGGDPLGMPDDIVENFIGRIAEIPSIERIRIGTRVLATMPMRITEKIADIFARYRKPGKRQVSIVTHIQHPYEVTPDTVDAVEKLRLRGIPVYNQMVYTFYISRRFEAVKLRRTLALVGIDPYYTFNTKGKEETSLYRVPIARLLQEQKEEARLLPGLSRTDEAVYNVPGLGKNYLRGAQHRDIISILPSGARLYEFHPWEKKISSTIMTHVSEDIPILDYLVRLESAGENPVDYETIWYYF